MSYVYAREALADQVRFVPDFPVEGVLLEDLTSVLTDTTTFILIMDEISARVEEFGADVIDSPDACGFLLGSAMMYKLGLGILAIRRKGKLLPPVLVKIYELECGMATLEIPASGIELKSRKTIFADDMLTTGGTLCAARALLGTAGVEVTKLCTVLEVKGPGAQEKLADLPLYAVNKE